MASSHEGDGLDQGVWQTICDAVRAIHRGDPTAAHAATDRFARRIPFDSQPGYYVWWLLRYRIADTLGHRPSADELHQIAETVRPKAALVIRDPACVENALLTVWKLASKEQAMADAQLLIGAIVALGVQLSDPHEQMEAARPHLADWWARNLDKFTAEGILDDRSTAEARLKARWPPH